MRNISVKYKDIYNKLNLEALKYAPDGNVITGYNVLNNKKILFRDSEDERIYIIPILDSELKINIEIITKTKKYFFEEITKDIDLQLD